MAIAVVGRGPFALRRAQGERDVLESWRSWVAWSIRSRRGGSGCCHLPGARGHGMRRDEDSGRPLVATPPGAWRWSYRTMNGV